MEKQTPGKLNLKKEVLDKQTKTAVIEVKDGDESYSFPTFTSNIPGLYVITFDYKIERVVNKKYGSFEDQIKLCSVQKHGDLK